MVFPQYIFALYLTCATCVDINMNVLLSIVQLEHRGMHLNILPGFELGMQAPSRVKCRMSQLLRPKENIVAS